MRTLCAIVIGLSLAGCLPNTPTLTLSQARSQVEQLPTKDIQRGVILVRIEQTGQVASLVPAGKNGAVTTWQSADRVALSFKSDVLISTRGLGDDLMASDMGKLPELIRTNASGGTIRQVRFLDGENQITAREYACDVRAEGNRITETCSSEYGQFQNTYWRGAGRSVVKSRQWVSDGIGYIWVEILGPIGRAES